MGCIGPLLLITLRLFSGGLAVRRYSVPVLDNRTVSSLDASSTISCSLAGMTAICHCEEGTDEATSGLYYVTV